MNARRETMNRSAAGQVARELAERLVAFEGYVDPLCEEDRVATCRVCEKLRRPLSHLAGPAGYSSLLARALTLAQREAPVLDDVRVTATGTLEGLEGEAAQASVTLIAHLIELLTTFIGESLTLRLLRDIWPDLPVPKSHLLRKGIM